MKPSLQMVQPPTGKDNYSEACKEVEDFAEGTIFSERVGWPAQAMEQAASLQVAT
jgi:hypothetical protein